MSEWPASGGENRWLTMPSLTDGLQTEACCSVNPEFLNPIINVSSSELLSKEWCDLVFEGRNKEYGAYKLRARAGVRYKRAVLAVVTFFLGLTLCYVASSLYVHYVVRKSMKDAEDAFLSHRPSDIKDGYKVKFLATARQAPTRRMAPGAVQGPPQIVEGLPPLQTIGVDGPISYDPGQELITTPIIDTSAIKDESLPIAKQKIVPTELVDQMPQFPGGPKAFMKWMDDHMVYPQSCIRQKKTGLVQLSFIVAADGYATDFEVKNAFDTQIYRAALTALKSMPKWTPGTDANGEPTPVKISLAVEFKM